MIVGALPEFYSELWRSETLFLLSAPYLNLRTLLHWCKWWWCADGLCLRHSPLPNMESNQFVTLGAGITVTNIVLVCEFGPGLLTQCHPDLQITYSCIQQQHQGSCPCLCLISWELHLHFRQNNFIHEQKERARIWPPLFLDSKKLPPISWTRLFFGSFG